jgi:hypothetical protein
MSKRPLKPVSKENLKHVIGGGDLPTQPPLNPNTPRGGWSVPSPSPDGPHGNW